MAELGLHICYGGRREALPDHVLQAGATTREAAAIRGQEKLFLHPSIHGPCLPTCMHYVQFISNKFHIQRNVPILFLKLPQHTNSFLIH